MIRSFKNYLTEEGRIAYFTFGRMNPPTTGHEKLLDVLSEKAGRNDYFVFLSQTQDKKSNPPETTTRRSSMSARCSLEARSTSDDQQEGAHRVRCRDRLSSREGTRVWSWW